MKKINYTGSSKVIKRLCEAINEIIEDGLGTDVQVDPIRETGEKIAEITVDSETEEIYAPAQPIFIDSDGYISIDYGKVEVEEDGE